jgi:hypothetical protein
MQRLLLGMALTASVVACTAAPGSPSASEAIPSELATSRAATPSASASASPFESAAPTPLPTVEAIPHEVAAAVNEELRAELLAMMAEDQAVRTGVAPPGDDRTAEELFGQMNAVDAANSLRMEEILEEHGWPGWSMVGEDGSLAAWVIIQHADLRLELQELGLQYLQGAVDADDASAGDLAYLVDRVRVAKNQPQVYGTQLTGDADGNLIPRTPIEDPANVDARRAAAGLGTLEEYFEEFREAMEEFEETP